MAHEMTRRKVDTGLDFGALRLGIERCDPELVLFFYAEDARLDVVNAGAPQAPTFQLRGRAEISKHLRAAFGQKASHSVGQKAVREERIEFREVCQYPDGGRVVVETTLEVRDGRIVRQKDVVVKDPPTERRIGPEETGEERLG